MTRKCINLVVRHKKVRNHGEDPYLEDHIRGFLRDYEPSCGPLFEVLLDTITEYTKDTVMLQVTWTRTRTASATPWMTMMTMTAFLTTVSVTAGGV